MAASVGFRGGHTSSRFTCKSPTYSGWTVPDPQQDVGAESHVEGTQRVMLSEKANLRGHRLDDSSHVTSSKRPSPRDGNRSVMAGGRDGGAGRSGALARRPPKLGQPWVLAARGLPASCTWDKVAQNCPHTRSRRQAPGYTRRNHRGNRVKGTRRVSVLPFQLPGDLSLFQSKIFRG